jgi:hypothetical protein
MYTYGHTNNTHAEELLTNKNNTTLMRLALDLLNVHKKQ